MSAVEILEQFRKLPFKERRKVAQQIRDEVEDELTPEHIAEFEKRAEKLRRSPEKGIAWEKIQSKLKTRSNKNTICAEK
jgi:putative addiction module component (TIGR02574 family)